MTAWTRVSPWDGRVVWQGEDEDPAPIVARVTGIAVVAERRRLLMHLAERLRARRAEAIELLVREAGKVRRDAEAEADLLPAKVTTTLDVGWRRCPPEPHEGILWRPRGLAAVLGPSNFPLHLLHGLVVPALAMGNPVVAKPSERTPALGHWYRQVLEEAGLAAHAGVVLGGHATAAALVADPAVATVAAVGGRPLGQALARAVADRPEVVLALELGGIGHVLITDDADLDAAVPAVADGAWRMAGQRCNATRIVHVPAHLLPRLHDALQHERQRWMPAGDPDGMMGPLIDAVQRERFVASVAPLASAVVHGIAAVEPLLVVATAPHPAFVHEHFGPVLILMPWQREDDAVAFMAANPARLAAAVWTQDAARFRALAARLPYGQVGWNRSTSGARGDLPFGGCGHSGNGHPAGAAATALFADETVWW